jgi:AMMECR1 domain-containing protein
MATVVLAARAGPDEILDKWRSADPGTARYTLWLARRAFDAYARRRERIDAPASHPALLDRPIGVFVSAMRHGAPRCCMGTLYPLQDRACDEIVANAAAAAGNDRRFSPVRPDELAGLTLIVSLVGRPRPITEAQAALLDPVRDGLAARYRESFGVVLSGETGIRSRMLAWARIRACAPPGAQVSLYRLEVARFMEPNHDSVPEPVPHPHRTQPLLKETP